MPLTKTEKDWLDERFGRIDDKMNAILVQTTKTNGRVNQLEDSEKKHYSLCPIAPRVREIEAEMYETKTLKKYAKLLVGGLVFFILMSAASMVKIFTLAI